MKQLLCLRCGEEMKYGGTRKIQLGETGWVLGDLPNLIAGAMDVCIYSCPKCGKIEFYHTQDEQSEIAQSICPTCGKKHDCDYPKCPFCGHRYV
ncbi:MAG: hypothetical protein E7410_04060 [Ruminococcaceae bacterium]|nr:hypothetical protein [Oscillospiraceae bacterium]